MSCTLCDVTEVEHYENADVTVKPYRCSRCGECYPCSHRLIGYRYWLCPDGHRTGVKDSKSIGVVVDVVERGSS